MDRARLIDLVGEALDLPESGREAFLRERCDDSALLAEGLSLIAAEKTAGGFLDRPTVRGLNSSAAVEGPGGAVGPYRLLELIGEGPSARVFMAEQRGKGGSRRVALRLGKSADPPAGAQFLHFLATRAALGSHPGIAALLDAGLADSGAPYFVTELVRGVAITTHAEGRAEAERLALWLGACDAVAHAHARGVSHGNLSPRNILVAEVGGGVKILDFGIPPPARGGAGASLASELREAVAVSEYQSPERGADARADVYALGVLISGILPGTPARVVGHIAANPDPARRFESAGALAEAVRRECLPRGAARKGWFSRLFGG